MDPIKRDTTETLFVSVLELVKQHGHYEKASAIMDYVLPNSNERARDAIELSNYRFDFIAIPNFGCEGIYIDCSIRGEYSEKECYTFDAKGNLVVETSRHIGTFKTLRSDVIAMKIMGELCGAMTYYADLYVNQNLDRYTPTKEREAMRKKTKEGIISNGKI